MGNTMAVTPAKHELRFVPQRQRQLGIYDRCVTATNALTGEQRLVVIPDYDAMPKRARQEVLRELVSEEQDSRLWEIDDNGVRWDYKTVDHATLTDLIDNAVLLEDLNSPFPWFAEYFVSSGSPEEPDPEVRLLLVLLEQAEAAAAQSSRIGDVTGGEFSLRISELVKCVSREVYGPNGSGREWCDKAHTAWRFTEPAVEQNSGMDGAKQ